MDKLAKRILRNLGWGAKVKHIGGGALGGGALSLGITEAAMRSSPEYRRLSSSDKNLARAVAALGGAAVGASGGADMLSDSLRRLRRARHSGRWAAQDHTFRKSRRAWHRARQESRQKARQEKAKWEQSQNYWDQRRGRRQQHNYSSWGSTNSAPGPKWSDFGVDMGGVKTKAEAKKNFRNAARKYHPDMGGDTEKMKRLNELWNDYKNSPEFSKLAALLTAPKETVQSRVEKLKKRLSTKNPAVDSFERKMRRPPGMPKETNTIKAASLSTRAMLRALGM